MTNLLRTEKAVLRAAPCRFVLFLVIELLYVRLPAGRVRAAGVVWPGKTDRTFSDAMTAVQRWLWTTLVLATHTHENALAKLSRPITTAVLYVPAPAA